MSLEAWGDEGPEGATRYEETEMRIEWDRIRARLKQWRDTFSPEMGDDLKAVVDLTNEQLDYIEGEYMTGKIE